MVAQAFQPVLRQLKPAATNNCLLIATQYLVNPGYSAAPLSLNLPQP